MDVFEKILAILAACFVIFIAGLLVRKQNKCCEMRKELADEVENSLKNVASEIELLTKEESVECDLKYLELRVASLNKTFQMMSRPNHRRIKNVKRKKNFTDD